MRTCHADVAEDSSCCDRAHDHAGRDRLASELVARPLHQRAGTRHASTKSNQFGFPNVRTVMRFGPKASPLALPLR